MSLVGKRTALAAVAVWGLGLGAACAFADNVIVPGSGKPDENCYTELSVSDATDATIDTSSPKATVFSCVDGSACDLDGACNNSCTFQVGVCINVPGETGCTPPGTLDKLTAKGNVNGVKGASGKLNISVPQLLEGSVCGAFIEATIPLKVSKKGTKSNKAKVKLQATAPKGTKPKKDKDKYELVCEPAPGGCGSSSGAFVD